MKRLTQKIVRELLDYDSESGLLTWEIRDRKWFKSDHECKRWNTRHAGKSAGSVGSRGYLIVGLLGKRFLVHRIIWLWMTGSWPNPEVDHENHNKSDNRWSNLFEVTSQKNGQNQLLPKNNTSGRIGVRIHAGAFEAQIMVGGRLIYLGRFSKFDRACAARLAAERKYGFHLNHGGVNKQKQK